MVEMNMVPAVLTGFMVLSSAFNSDLKVFVWLMTILPFMVGLAFLQKDCLFKPAVLSPMLSSFFIMYTLGYIICPMALYNDWNFVAIAVFLLLLAGDIMMSQKAECYSKLNAAKGAVLGLVAGAVMFFVAKGIGLAKYLYYTTANSSMYCSKPREQNFKCYVYKNGTMLSEL